MRKNSISELFISSTIIFIVCLVLTYVSVWQVETFIETNNIAIPEVSTSFAALYFLAAAAVMGVILYFIPISLLRLVLKAMFGFLFAWGVFVFLALFAPAVVAVVIAAALGLVWFFRPRIWLHDLLMIFSLVSLASTMGPMFSPWAVSLLLGILSVYDLVAVTSGYMVWMVKQMSLSESVPAFFIPRALSSWNMSFKEIGITTLLSGETGHRELSVLGGGDLGLPLVLITSVYFTHGFVPSLIVAVFSLLGLFFAYVIQIYILKGKPLPALPPISLVAFIGYLIALLVMRM